MNVLAAICYGWAAVGIGSRIAMGAMGSKWKSWELSKAYSNERPKWVVLAAIVGILLIGYTWYRAITGPEELGWIVAVLVSLTSVKIGAFLVRYDQFRTFVSKALSDPKKMAALNVAVIIFSGALIAMGAVLYS